MNAPDKTFALIVGIESYALGGADLLGPCTDAIRMAKHLLAHNVLADHIFLFAQPLPTDGKVSEALSQLRRDGVHVSTSAGHDEIESCWRTALVENRPLGSQLLVYWSGHGLTHLDGSRILLCADYKESLKNRIFQVDHFLRAIHQEPFENQLHFFDVCGNYPNLPVELSLPVPPRREAVNQTAFFASVEGKYAQNTESGGAFTSVLLRTLEDHDPWSDSFEEALFDALDTTTQRPFRIVSQSLDRKRSLSATAVLQPADVPTGAIPFDDPNYIARPQDFQVMELVRVGGRSILLRGPRQFGKSSLLSRMSYYATNLERQVVEIEAAITFSSSALASPQAFFLAFAEAISTALNFANRSIQKDPRDLTDWIEKEVLRRSSKPITLIIDEADRLLMPSFSEDIFGMFKSWQSMRARPNKGEWKKLEVFLAMSQKWELSVAAMRGQVFATTFDLRPFDSAELLALVKLYGANYTRADLDVLLTLLGGHPYLSRLAVAAQLPARVSPVAMLSDLLSESGPLTDHLRTVARWLHDEQELKAAFADIMQGRGSNNPILVDRLIAEGLVKLENGKAVPSCDLYSEYFKAKL